MVNCRKKVQGQEPSDVKPMKPGEYGPKGIFETILTKFYKIYPW